MVVQGSLLFSATLKNAVGLKAVLDLVDKDFSQDAGENKQQRSQHHSCISSSCYLQLFKA